MTEWPLLGNVIMEVSVRVIEVVPPLTLSYVL